MPATIRHLRLALVTLAIAVLPACADDDEVDGDVARGWRATNLAIGEQQADWGTSVDVDGNLTLDLGCTDGGRAHIEGSYTNAESFDVSIEFDGCTADGVTISGDLAMHAEVATTATSTDVSISYSGDLQWSGDAQGSCAIDVSASVSTEITGSGADTEVEVDAEFRGEVCGYDAQAVVSASAG